MLMMYYSMIYDSNTQILMKQGLCNTLFNNK